MPKGVYLRTREHIEKVALASSLALRGRKFPHMFLPQSEELKRRKSLARKGVMLGARHPHWKGDGVSYRNLHRWVEKIAGKAAAYPCMLCAGTRGSKRIVWMNLSGVYKRDLKDWTTACQKCNLAFDAHCRKANA